MSKYTKISPLSLSPEEEEEFGHDIIYATSFHGNVKSYLWYRTTICIVLGILTIPFYGIGLLLLLWSPLIMYINYKDIKTRKLFVTSDSIIYVTSPPACIPCLGVNKTEKHVLLSLVTDVIVSQGWYAACFGLKTVQIENAGQGSGASNKQKTADLSFIGINDPQEFKKIILKAAAMKRAGQALSRNDIETFLSNDSSVLLPSAPNNTASWMYGTFSSPVLSAPSFDPTKLDQLNDTMIRIEQLLASQQPLLD